MSAAPPTSRSPGRSARSRARSAGFTLIELSIVLVIIAIISALALATLGAIRQKNAISLAPKQFMSALATARQEAMANGQSVVFVMIGNQGAADSVACSGLILPSQSTRCVRYWIIEDRPDAPGGRFDVAAELATFDQTQRFDNPTRALNGDGDRVLAGGYLPTPIFLGKATTYSPPGAPPTTSTYQQLWNPTPLFGMRPDCSFCLTIGGVPRLALRFDAKGQMEILAPVGLNPQAGVVFFTAAKSSTETLLETRTVAVFEPFGFATDRLGASIR
jgi:prepilin-type N-terminal cleavage/methylation domain-containing protein